MSLYSQAINQAFDRGSNYGLSPFNLPKESVSSSDVTLIDSLFDEAFRRHPQNFQKDRCIDACMLMLSLLWKEGIQGELILGSVFLDGSPYINTNIKYLKKELKKGLNHGGRAQDVHCWIALDRKHIFDPVLTWYTEKRPGYLLDPHDVLRNEGVEYVPLLAGWEFVDRTNKHPISEWIRAVDLRSS